MHIVINRLDNTSRDATNYSGYTFQTIYATEKFGTTVWQEKYSGGHTSRLHYEKSLICMCLPENEYHIYVFYFWLTPLVRSPDVQPQAEDLGLLCGIEEVELSYPVDTLFYAKKNVNVWWATSCDYRWILSLKASFLKTLIDEIKKCKVIVLYV